MRLTEDEKNKILAVVQSYCTESATLYLYGSRIDDAKRGGDIDLVLLVPSESEREKIDAEIYILLAHLKEEIGDQHIDFSVITPRVAQTDPFFKMILATAIPLC